MLPTEILKEIFLHEDFATKICIRRVSKECRMIIDSLLCCQWKYYPTEDTYNMFQNSTLPLPGHFNKLTIKSTQLRPLPLLPFFIPQFITTVHAIVRVEELCQFIKRLPGHLQHISVTCHPVILNTTLEKGTFAHFSNIQSITFAYFYVQLTETLPNTLKELDIYAFQEPPSSLQFLPASLTRLVVRHANYLTTGLEHCHRHKLPQLQHLELVYYDCTFKPEHFIYFPLEGPEITVTMDSCSLNRDAAISFAATPITTLHIFHFRSSKALPREYFPPTVERLSIFGSAIYLVQLQEWILSATNLKLLEISVCSSLGVAILNILPPHCKVKASYCKHFQQYHMKQYPQLQVEGQWFPPFWNNIKPIY